MPLSDSQIWTVSPTVDRVAVVRGDLDGALGESIDYDRTIDGAWTLAAARLAFDVDQGVALALSTQFRSSMPPAALVAYAEDVAGVDPRAAQAQVVLGRLTAAAEATLPTDTLVLDDQEREWDIEAVFLRNVDDSLTELEAVNGDWTIPTGSDYDAQIRCRTAGAIAYTSFTFEPSVTDLSIAPGDGASILQVGLDAETTAQLRARLAGQEARPSGSYPGLRAALLNVPSVVGVSFQGGGGDLRVALASGSGGLYDAYQAIRTLYEHAPAGTTFLGDTTYTITSVDGTSVSVSIDTATTQTVAVVATLTIDGTLTEAETEEAAEAALLAYFGGLGKGDTARHFHALSALRLPGVTGAALTLDGGTADITPTLSTSLLVASITVAFA